MVCCAIEQQQVFGSQYCIGRIVTHRLSDNQLLMLNVGFLLKEGAGYSREFAFDEPGAVHAEDVELSKLRGALRLSRTPQGLVLQGVLRAQLSVQCVRCLTPCEVEIGVPFEELFILPSNPEAHDPQNLYVIDEGGFIDLAPIVREEAIVSVPLQVFCRPDCKGLCPQCGNNWNAGPCDCSPDEVNPRLAALLGLLDAKKSEER